MTSAAQVSANRSNAQKSTGPRTAEGKAVAAQNAVRHGLLAKEVVVKGEDAGQFEYYRRQMLAELAPAGPVQEMLAQRIVHLSWRLRRAERLQALAFDQIEDKSERPEPTMSPEDASWMLERLVERGITFAGHPAPPRGRKVVQDFNQELVLDRLLVYERRIENSLYRTMAELRKERLLREKNPPADGGLPRSTGVSPMTVENVPGQTCPEFVERKDCDIHGQACPELAEWDARATHGRDAHATEPEGGTPNESRQTNPIGAGSPDGPVLGGAEVQSDLAPGEVRQTNPIQGSGSTPSNTPSQPRPARKFPNTVNEETYDSYLGRWVWTGYVYASKDSDQADSGRRQ